MVSPTVSTSQVADIAYCRHPERRDDCRRVRRVLDSVAVRVRRVPPYGAWLWRKRNSGEK
jgi:hypothetical protein